MTFEGETGTVEDVTLTYTWLRTGSDARLIIPNERLAAGVLRNDSIRSPTVALEVSVWLAPDADETAALAAVARARGDAATRASPRSTDDGRCACRSPGRPGARRPSALAREARAARQQVLRRAARSRVRSADARDEPADLNPLQRVPDVRDESANAAVPPQRQRRRRSRVDLRCSSACVVTARRPSRGIAAVGVGHQRRQQRARRSTTLQADRLGRHLARLRRRRQTRLGFIQADDPAHAGHGRRDPAGRRATRRSRSRTGASTSTRASTSRASSAPRSRTLSPAARPSRAARR